MKKKMTFKEFSVSLVILTVLVILAVGWWNGKLSPQPSPSPSPVILSVSEESPRPTQQPTPTPRPTPKPTLRPTPKPSPSPTVGADAPGGPPAVPSSSPTVGADAPSPAVILSEGEESPRPTPTSTPRPTPQPSPAVILSEGAAEVEGSSEPTVTYVLNLNTKKFHYPDCPSVEQIKPKNREDFTGSREEVLARGFDPCKNCNP